MNVLLNLNYARTSYVRTYVSICYKWLKRKRKKKTRQKGFVGTLKLRYVYVKKKRIIIIIIICKMYLCSKMLKYFQRSLLFILFKFFFSSSVFRIFPLYIHIHIYIYSFFSTLFS